VRNPGERADRDDQLQWGDALVAMQDWTEAGDWRCLHEILLATLRAVGLLSMDDAAIDGSHVRAPKGDSHTGPSPSTAAATAETTTRSRTGTEHPRRVVDQ
jgi:hypothetical protein